jgi:hypothetical protein
MLELPVEYQAHHDVDALPDCWEQFGNGADLLFCTLCTLFQLLNLFLGKLVLDDRVPSEFSEGELHSLHLVCHSFVKVDELRSILLLQFDEFFVRLALHAIHFGDLQVDLF